MKKSLIALAMLGAFAGAASAQSSVTIYGFIDVAATKSYGNEDKRIVDGALYGGGSRLGFRGVEDLGGGWKGIFGFEHRLNADDGTQNSAAMWNGYSTVGLVTPFGMFNLGRQYTPAFLMIQNQIDPFGGESVAQGREIGMRFGTPFDPDAAGPAVKGSTGQYASAVYKTRFADSIRYDLTMGGFNFGAAVGEGATNGGTNKAWSVAANYAAGPFWVGAGYENPGADEDKGWNVGARWNAGFATFAAGYGRGTTATALDATSWLVGVTVPVGAVDIKAVYATSDIDSPAVGTTRKLGLGVHYNFSKRTKVYADFARIGGDATALGTAIDDNKTGYDFGIKHSF